MLEEYQIETLALLNGMNAQFDALTVENQCDLYSKWSHETACAGWLCIGEKGARAFIHWATTAPINDL